MPRVSGALTEISPLAHLPVVNSTCSDFNHGSALHIAASNLCLGAAKCLLEHGANPALRVLPPWPSTVIFLPFLLCPFQASRPLQKMRGALTTCISGSSQNITKVICTFNK